MEEEEEVEIVNDNGQLSVDYGLMIEDLASEHQVIMAHAQDVDVSNKQVLEASSIE